MRRRRLRLGRSLAVLAALLASTAAAAVPLLWQTSSRGDDVRVFDLEKKRLVRRLVLGPEPHGIAAPADASVVFVTLEANDRPRGELLWIDPRSYRVEHRMEICREPHALAATPDGRWLYVPCRDEHYSVIDARTRALAARIRTGGRPHNVQISHDGRLALLSPIGEAARVTVVDIAGGHEVVGEIAFAGSVRPSALSVDGRLFQHVDGLNGFQVADVARREVVETVRHGSALGWLLVHPRLGWLGPSGLQRCHGLAIRPGEREIWSACGASLTIHDITGSAHAELARVALPSKAYWLAFSPDGRWAVAALAGADEVAVVDAARRSVVAQLAAGAAPKRNLVIDLDRAEDAPQPQGSLHDSPRIPSRPSRTSHGTIASAAAGSAHHHPPAAFAARPRSSARER